jgi:hypothetical protein
MRLFLRFAAVMVLSAMPVVASDAIVLTHDSADPVLTTGGKTYFYFHEAFRPSKLLTNAVGAATAQYRNDPEEWGQGARGFGKRYGSRLAVSASDDTIAFVVGMALHADPRYVVLRKGTNAERIKFSVKHAFISRYDDGTERFAYARISGAFGSAFLASTWYPKRISDPTHSLEYALENVGSYVVRSLVHEYRPELNRVFHIKR